MSPRASKEERLKAFKDAFFGLMMPVIILGGIYGGIFTPTEAAAVSVFYGLFVGIFIYREIDVKKMIDIMVDSCSTTATVMFITMGASLFAYVLTRARIDLAIKDVMLSITGGNWIIFFIIVNIVLLIAGCFLDSTSALYIFTPLYIANYCQNYCIYCGFNCYNNIRRKKLSFEEIEHEMQVIAKTGMEEILMLTGESRAYSDVHYIGEAVKIAKKYFKNIGIEIYPVNVDEYRYLHECGVDYVTVFQETYNTDKYETLHLMGHKRVWPYRFDSQERALMGGMRGAGFSALLGLDDFRKDALATALHVYYINRKYPHAELSLSCPRLRPIVNNDKINPRDVGEKELCQVLCAYRIFLPFAGITVSSRESADFRNGITKICATKVSAGVSTGIGDHEEKYEGKQEEDVGDEQFEINDSRSFKTMYDDMEQGGLQPVLNDYIYV